MPWTIRIALLVVAVIHLLPVPGVMGADALHRLYGISFSDPDTVVLMRHRAVLFGLLGAVLAYAAFRPAVQGLALIAGWISVIAYLGLWWSAHSSNPALHRVAVADLVALAALAVGSVAWCLQKR
jgi:hypothetical protein